MTSIQNYGNNINMCCHNSGGQCLNRLVAYNNEMLSVLGGVCLHSTVDRGVVKMQVQHRECSVTQAYICVKMLMYSILGGSLNLL